LGEIDMATSKQLQARIESLKAKIEKHQTALSTLRAQQKELKDQLAEAKKAAKAKAP
jgi:septal ring factor EnvC (AmiA/AmiB activator)